MRWRSTLFRIGQSGILEHVDFKGGCSVRDPSDRDNPHIPGPNWKRKPRRKKGDGLVVRNLLLIAACYTLLSVNAAAQLSYTAEAVSPNLQQKLDAARGKPVYLCSYASSRLVFVNHENGKGEPGLFYGSQVSSARLERLSPYKVTSIDKVGSLGDTSTYSVRLDIGGGQEVAFRSSTHDSTLLQAADVLSYLVNADEGMFTMIPFRWEAHREAISEGDVNIGMDRDEVSCSIGSPEDSNDYGSSGGLQLVYRSGDLIVYMLNGKVSAVQRFHLHQ